MSNRTTADFHLCFREGRHVLATRHSVTECLAFAPHVLTIRDLVARPFEEYERDADGLPVVADVLKESTIVFPDAPAAVDYLVLSKGLTPARALAVVGRACEFTVEPSSTPTTFRVYRVTR